LRTLLRGDTATSTSPPPRRLGTAEPPTLERRHSQRRRSETLQPPTFALVKPAQCLTINVSSEHLHLILQLPSTPQMDSAHTTRGIARQLSSVWLTKATAGKGGWRGEMAAVFGCEEGGQRPGEIRPEVAAAVAEPRER